MLDKHTKKLVIKETERMRNQLNPKLEVLDKFLSENVEGDTK